MGAVLGQVVPVESRSLVQAAPMGAVLGFRRYRWERCLASGGTCREPSGTDGSGLAQVVPVESRSLEPKLSTGGTDGSGAWLQVVPIGSRSLDRRHRWERCLASGGTDREPLLSSGGTDGSGAWLQVVPVKSRSLVQAVPMGAVLGFRWYR
ncbi:hypothetical protein J6590_036854 [Homalodisca vitripennis]|nr:hypothetical protein J6590_036854 [Homalodisca vitripennis]